MTYLKRQQYVDKYYEKYDLNSAIQNMKFVLACKDKGIDKDVIIAVMMSRKK